MRAKKERQIVVRVSEDLLLAVRERAEQEERSLAQMVRLALKQYLTPAG